MPELPEVETVRRYLAPVLEGAVLLAAEVRHARTARRNARPTDLADRLAGRRAGEVRRQGKFLLVDLDGDLIWVTHLGMSGRVQVARHGEMEAPHTHLRVLTDRDEEVRLVDPRTFGFAAVFTPEEYAASSLAGLGPDAYTDLPRAAALAARMAGRRVPIKALLLDQRFLAGLGNIYADEVLHRAGVVGSRAAGTLDRGEVKRLRAAIPPILEAGIRSGGTSLADLAYLLPDGRAGGYLARLRVYGREGEPCRTCGTPLRRSVIAARSSYWCPACQR
ncbi:MAG: bifunctional DNA-formamidopyrimidine glycosylase/DNA-(apurinic or apyrimidinic site) lyase [Acidimicrobiia bacterium]